MSDFYDGLKNVFNQLVNRRSALSQNIVTANVLSGEQQRTIFRTGLGSKIAGIKGVHPLDDTLIFESTADEEFYKARLDKIVKRASKFMIAFGRGIILLHSPGDDLSKPLGTVDDSLIKIDVFDGDMVTVSDINVDLSRPRYLKPNSYHVRGATLHWSRVIDFTYVKPPELDAPSYQYGGISEFELVYNQIINDGIVERASTTILEKSSNFIYKIQGFKDALRSKKDKEVVEYFGRVEDFRSNYGAVLIDSEDDVTSITQQLANLSEVDQITLRRLAMVTGIVLPILIGENVKGLNSTGDNESKIHQQMLSGIRSEYLLDPINELMRTLGRGKVSFKDAQGQTPGEEAAYEKIVIDNAVQLNAMGEDGAKYLEGKGVIVKDKWEDFFGGEEADNGGEADHNQIPEFPEV